MLRRLTCILASLAIAAGAGTAGAQQISEARVGDAASVQMIAPLLTVDFDRLFTQSAFGERIAREFAESRDVLARENARIAEALRSEELSLTEQRAIMAPDVFRTEAEAFDEKAQSIRRAQDAKEAALDEMLSEGRDQFLSVTRPVLGQVMIDRGAVAILDRRSVLLSLASIDITDEAVARIDAAIGDGAANADGAMPDPDLAPELPLGPVQAEPAEDTPDLTPEDASEN